MERSDLAVLLSTNRDCLDRPVTLSRAYPSGGQDTLPLVAPPREVPRKLGMYFTVKAFSAGPLDAMMALRVCQPFGPLPLDGRTYMLTSTLEMVYTRL